MNVLFLIGVVLAFGAALYIRALLARRAIFKVIGIFRQHGAVRPESARTLLELGLGRPDFVQRITRPRDYKQEALQTLAKRGILIEGETGKWYLAEERLKETFKSDR